MANIPLAAFYTESKLGKTGLTVTVDVWRVTRSTGATSEIATGVAATEVGDGLYIYLVDADLTLYTYFAVFKTATATVDAQHIPAVQDDWTLARATELARLDALVSSRAVAGDAMTLADNAITAAVIATDAIDADAIAADAITAAKVAADVSTEIDTALSAAHGSGSWQGGAGAGSTLFEYTVTDSSTAAVLAGVTVWVTTDAAGAVLVASGTTNASGVVSFWLDAGTYYFWRRLAGYAFTDPDTEVVT